MALNVVQSTGVVGSGVGSVTTPAIPTTTGNLIVADISYYAVTGGFLSLTDSVGTLTWAQSLGELTSSSGTNFSRQRYAENITGNANHTFTFNSTGSDFPSLAVKEISGALTSGSLAETITDVTQVTSPYSKALVTGAPANKILCAYWACDTQNSDVMTQTGSFINDQSRGTHAVNELLFSSHLIISAAGSNTFSMTLGSNEAASIGIAAFIAAAVVAVNAISGDGFSPSALW